VRLRQLWPSYLFDAVVVALAVAAVVEAAVDPSQSPRAVTMPAAFLWTLPLLLRRRFPLGAPSIVFLTLASESLLLAGEPVTSSTVNALALIAAFAVVGAHDQPRAALAGAGIGYATLVAIVGGEHPRAADALPIFVFCGAAWIIGRAFSERGRRAAVAEERADLLERTHELAAADERARIARELHDIIAHSVSVMTVQAGAARLLLDEDPGRAREPLLSVEETGRQALADMRRLLGILRGGDERAALVPQPGIGEVGGLVDQVRAAGLETELTVEGDPVELQPGLDLTAYRIVQEALTNALKHASPPRARVVVRYARDTLDLEITNDGGTSDGSVPGLGLSGMRERVTLYGGTLHAGAIDGGFVVRAALPLGAGES
jgi:signal transduction histidine kinase